MSLLTELYFGTAAKSATDVRVGSAMSAAGPLCLQAGRPAVELSLLKRLGVTSLQPFLDPLGRIAKRPGSDALTPFVLWGMPISYIIDREVDCQAILRGRLNGPPNRGEPFSITMSRDDPLNSMEFKTSAPLRGVRAYAFDADGTLFDFAAAARQCSDVLGDESRQLAHRDFIERLPENARCGRQSRQAGHAA